LLQPQANPSLYRIRVAITGGRSFTAYPATADDESYPIRPTGRIRPIPWSFFLAWVGK